VAFLVPGHPKYEHGIVNLYCKYCDDDDQSYIKRQALKRLNLDEGTLGEVILSFLDKDQSLDRVFFVQDHTSRGEELESDILFGMKPAARSVIEESPLEEFSPAPFDGHNSTFSYFSIHILGRAEPDSASRTTPNPPQSHVTTTA
jgi:hypothetical protein